MSTYAGVGGAVMGSLAALYGKSVNIDQKIVMRGRDAAIAAVPLLSNRRGTRLKTGTLSLQFGSYVHEMREALMPFAMRALVATFKILPVHHRSRDRAALKRLWRVSLRL